MESVHSRHYLPRQPHQAREARSYVQDACDGLPPDVLMTAQLLTTELVSNALRHATGPIVLDVEVDAREVRVTVADSTSSGPVMIASGHEDTSGRGIKLVDALAQEWGVDQLPHQRGKSVWFTLNPAW